MRESGRCPKCGSTEIWNDAHLSKRERRSILVKGGILFKTARYYEYVCSSCGYMERYVDNKGLENIKNQTDRSISD